ncbi:hypothetical protein BDY21DRAFT_137774 [Lineolata rhizophorae]|uniref:3-oxoacyl-reductase n=1 Tax=Lineolata rhizophorae TaxID=578093 RepID=A0A6A6PAT7_9PEZI|nr:hypothetical protein BDY21DRAFT_137774 [Lineolata rhizophorae]
MFSAKPLSLRLVCYHHPLLTSKPNPTTTRKLINGGFPSRLLCNGASLTTASPLSLKGTNVVITGGSSGIGRAIAIEFARQGSYCTLIGRNEDRLKSALHEICDHSMSNVPHRYVVGDVRDRSFWDALSSGNIKSTRFIESPVETFLADDIPERLYPNVLINNAGVTHSSLLLREHPSIIESVIETNLMGTIWGCKYMAKLMLPKPTTRRVPNSRCIINISSLLATHGGKGCSVYSASKAGVLGFTRALSAELGPLGVRINAIVPGYTNTAMLDGLSITTETIEKSIPASRVGTPEDIAHAAMFLAQNGYANNCIVNLDGGLSAVM